MGVPGFFAWLSRKYGKFGNIITDRTGNEKPKWLYLDYNCLIHPQCFEVLGYFENENNIEKLEKLMITRILNYTEFLFEWVNAEENYIAIDGVAPLAKMSQQRERRYRSIWDNKLKTAVKKAHNLENNERWSNVVISPGTQFMEKLHNEIKKWMKKMAKQKIKITYSSYHTPGEGEHKIMDHIRKKIKQQDTIVIYGLDADLIFLALASNHRKLWLLREADQFNKGNKMSKLVETDFMKDVQVDMLYVDINEVRKAINYHLHNMIDNRLRKESRVDGERDKNNISNNYDFTTDFIIICYLLGNDFLPHLPSVYIKTDGLDFLIEIYIDTILVKGKHLVQSVNPFIINNSVLRTILSCVAKYEPYYFTNILPKFLQRRLRRKYMQTGTRSKDEEEYYKEMWKLDNLLIHPDKYLKNEPVRKNIIVDYIPYDDVTKGNVQKVKKQIGNKDTLTTYKVPFDPLKLGSGHVEEWKYRYYNHYFGTDDRPLIKEDQELLINVMGREYMRGLAWVGEYYFVGVPSWEWNYPYSHAPFVSDIVSYMIKNPSSTKIHWENSKPSTPFEQLLTILPPQRSNLLPKQYQDIINEPDSPLTWMMVHDFEMDLYYKEALWKASPKIPLPDINKIRNYVKHIELNKNDKILNKTLGIFTNHENIKK